MSEPWNVDCPNCKGKGFWSAACETCGATQQVPNPAIVAELARLREIERLVKELFAAESEPMPSIDGSSDYVNWLHAPREIRSSLIAILDIPTPVDPNSLAARRARHASRSGTAEPTP